MTTTGNDNGMMELVEIIMAADEADVHTIDDLPLKTVPPEVDKWLFGRSIRKEYLAAKAALEKELADNSPDDPGEAAETASLLILFTPAKPTEESLI